MLIFLVVLVILVAAVYFFMQQAQFGRLASGEALKKLMDSPNYRDGQFQNLSPTPALAEGASYSRVMKEFFFGKNKRATPGVSIPTQKTSLFDLDPAVDVLVWFGHSSYFMQLDGMKFLVDPVLSGNASPLNFTTRSFVGSDIYTPDDFPEIDYLFITHDHYDHLDYRTVIKLRSKIKRVITGLGVGTHLRHWGFDSSIVSEHDWNEEVKLETGYTVNTTPARHFSGRTFKRNTSLWMSFVLTTPTKRVYIGGDSGYDSHFSKIGEQFGPFDLAILENGQYNQYWKYIHMMPEEVVQAAIDLKTKVLFPVHWSKFSLSLHAWDEPMIRVTREAEARGVPVIHPMIGEAVFFSEPQVYSAWWENID